MKGLLFAVWLTLILGTTLVNAQEKVAEGQYQVRGVDSSGAPVTKTVTRWVLFAAQSGGYHLRSEIEQQSASIRLAQVEELNDRFVPTAIGYELYRGEQKFPDIADVTANCSLSNGVVCSGIAGNDRAVASRPFSASGPFWIWIEGLFSMDMPWLFDGALNMARPAVKGKINTLVISGGTGFMIGDAINVAALQKVTKPGQVKVVAPQSPTAWSIKSEDETIFELIASEKFDIDGTKVAVKHYSTSDGEKLGGLWVTDSGLLTKKDGSG